jgi:DUF177 domain-containing protein
MSGALHTWYSLPDLDGLAERNAELCGEIQLNKLARLRGMLRDDDGSVRAVLSFRPRRDGWLIVGLEYRAALKLTCQRCLGSMIYDAVGRVEFVVLEDSSLESQAPASFEPVVLDGDRFSPAQLIEDELIISMPLVPRHTDKSKCGMIADRLESEDEQDTIRDAT